MFCSRLNENWLRLPPSRLGGIPPKSSLWSTAYRKSLFPLILYSPRQGVHTKKSFLLQNMRHLFTFIISITFVSSWAQSSLPVPSREAKPGLRWWWLGSAVDKENLSWCLSEYSKTGVGAVEITPIYGVRDNEDKELNYLSPRWIKISFMRSAVVRS